MPAQNAITWFEIPVADMDRAKTFYETIFGTRFEVQTFGEDKMATFPNSAGAGLVGGALVQSAYHKTGNTGETDNTD